VVRSRRSHPFGLRLIPADSRQGVQRAGQIVNAHGTESPRGICWRRYRTEADGSIAEARITPPPARTR